MLMSQATDGLICQSMFEAFQATRDPTLLKDEGTSEVGQAAEDGCAEHVHELCLLGMSFA